MGKAICLRQHSGEGQRAWRWLHRGVRGERWSTASRSEGEEPGSGVPWDVPVEVPWGAPRDAPGDAAEQARLSS